MRVTLKNWEWPGDEAIIAYDMLRNIDVNMLTIIGTILIFSEPKEITSTEIYIYINSHSVLWHAGLFVFVF